MTDRLQAARINAVIAALNEAGAIGRSLGELVHETGVDMQAIEAAVKSLIDEGRAHIAKVWAPDSNPRLFTIAAGPTPPARYAVTAQSEIGGGMPYLWASATSLAQAHKIAGETPRGTKSRVRIWEDIGYDDKA